MKRALVVDDHPVVREALRVLLQRHFPSIEVETSAGGEDVIQELCGTSWAFVVLDVSLSDQSGLKILKQIKTCCPTIPIIVFTVHSERQYARRALRAGAIAFLSKDRSPYELVELVEVILRGGKITKRIASEPALTIRERQVLSLLGKGMSRSDIAEQLGISEKTVSTYQAKLLEKLDFRNLMELIRYAIDEGLAE